MSKKKNPLFTAAAVVLATVMTASCLLQNVPASETGSLTISFTDGETAVSGAEFDIWNVADPYGTLTESFADSGVLLSSSLGNSEWTQAAVNLQTFVQERGIPALATAVTNETGQCTFNDLARGLYLVTGSVANTGAVSYTVQTFIAAVDGNSSAEPKFSANEPPTLDSYAYAGGYDPDMSHRTKMVAEDPDATITDEVYLGGLIPGDEYELRSVILNDTYDFGFPVPALFNGKSMRDNYGSDLGTVAESLVMDVFDAWGIPYPETSEAAQINLIPDGALTWHPDGMWFNLPAPIDEEKIAALASNPDYAEILGLIAFQKQPFTAEAESMTVSSVFEHLNTLNKGGQALRVFQILSKDHAIIATEVVAQYERETVYVEPVEIDTVATVNGIHSAKAGGEAVLTDTVTYSGLTPGKEYRLEGVLMDKDTGEALLVQGGNVTASMTFTPGEASGSVDMSFTLNTSELAGRSAVVFETLYRGETEIASHREIDDPDQTVEFLEPGGEPLPGTLFISKQVTGEGDTEKEWHFTVTLDPKLNGQYGDIAFTDGVGEVTLKHGETKKAENLPAGTKYTVTEAEANQDGYVTTESGTAGEIPDGGSAAAEFINDLQSTPVPGEPSPTPEPGEPTPVPGEPTPTPTPEPGEPTPVPGEPTPTPVPGEPTPGPGEPTPVPGEPTPTPTPEQGEPGLTPTPGPGEPSQTPAPGTPTPSGKPNTPSTTPGPGTQTPQVSQPPGSSSQTYPGGPTEDPKYSYSTETQSPKTGDSSHAEIWFALFLASLVCAATVRQVRSKRKV